MMRIFFITLSLLFAVDSFAAQMATVTADYAIIYGDTAMSSPLGKVPRGKEIKIGEVLRGGGKLYSTVVSGKLAYIRKDQIQTESQVMAQNRAEMILKDKRPLSKSDELGLGLVRSNIQLKSQNLPEGKAQSVPLTGFLLQWESPRGQSHDRLGFGLEILSGDQDGHKYEERSLYIRYSHRLGEIFSVHAFPFLSLKAIMASYTYTPIDLSTNGYGAAAQAGISFEKFLTSKLKLKLELAGDYQYITGMKILDESINLTNTQMTMAGGLSYIY